MPSIGRSRATQAKARLPERTFVPDEWAGGADEQGVDPRRRFTGQFTPLASSFCGLAGLPLHAQPGGTYCLPMCKTS
jgi:hypothetical protein